MSYNILIVIVQNAYKTVRRAEVCDTVLINVIPEATIGSQWQLTLNGVYRCILCCSVFFMIQYTTHHLLLSEQLQTPAANKRISVIFITVHLFSAILTGVHSEEGL